MSRAPGRLPCVGAEVLLGDAENKLDIDTRNSNLGFGNKVVEVYANDRQAIARRVYPTLEGDGVALLSEGGDADVRSAMAWEMMPANLF